MIASRISDLARADSASVSTISILGLIFLPGTFVSVGLRQSLILEHLVDGVQAIFGMNFFDLSRDELEKYSWTVSSNFWLYWVVTAPITLLTVLFWLLWQRPGGAADNTYHRGQRSLLPTKRWRKSVGRANDA